MNPESTTRKAEGLGKIRSTEQGAESKELSAVSESVPQFANEQQFLNGLKTFMQAGRESRAPGVALVAREWDRKLSFCILLNQRQRSRREAARAKRVALKLQVSAQSSGSATASPSSLRIRVGVSPSPD